MKTCIVCKIEKNRNEFEGRRNTCKSCRKLYYKGHREKHKDERNAYNREYRKNNPEIIQENWDSYYARNKEKLKAKQKIKYRENPIRHILYAAKQRAEKFGYPFEVTENDLTLPEVCPVLGIPLKIGGRKYDSPSIDKIIPELGYVKGNVAIVSLRANQMKGTATLAELKKLVKFLEEFEAAKSLDTATTSVV